MALDYLASIEADGARAVAALAAGRDQRIPWSDAWTVQACARHLGVAHRAITTIVAGRPDKEWSAFGEVTAPDEDDPGLGTWLAEGVAELLAELGSVLPDEPCWTWWPENQTAGFWPRRMAHETLVHRWDLEYGAGITGAPMDPALAADGIDEYLDVFLGMARLVRSSPGDGETVHVHCTDTDTGGEWLVAFPGAGARELRREHAKGDLALRGPAEGLLLHVWGRLPADTAGIEVLGDRVLQSRWTDLFPPM